MATYLVTGGTGLIGSNICRQLIEAGDRVRALVRPGSDSGPLVAVGVESVEGDIQSFDDVVRASVGCDAIINSAAVLGGAAQQMEEQKATNVGGAFHVFDAAAEHGTRVVTLSTTTFLRHDTPLTESSPMAERWSDDPYTVTKGQAYREAMRRVDEEGADIVVVIPGGTYGPGLSVSRAMHATSYNRLLRGGINGKIVEYAKYPVPWVYADDVAACSVAATKHGATGAKYLAFGAEDAQSTAAFLNAACEVAGVPHRVADVVIDPSDPGAVGRYGATLVDLAQRTFPVPWFDNTVTRETLGYSPCPRPDAMAVTVDWLRANGQIG
ncbi:MAG: dihydroflavonol 4-reductase [Acidimicrobiales bacterium]|jgi:dihydroflavonol-4-reductase|nr:dihydroflavonol 4-reductase [Acidimicrobiales bacterium]